MVDRQGVRVRKPITGAVALVGSPDFERQDFVERVTYLLPEEFAVVGFGTSSGVNKWVKDTADHHGRRYIRCAPQWHIFGNQARLFATRKLVNSCNGVVIFSATPTTTIRNVRKMVRKRGGFIIEILDNLTTE